MSAEFLLRPPALGPGARIGLLSPASALAAEEDYALAADRVRSLGYEPVFAPGAREREDYLAGSDACRAADLNTFFAARDIDAIWSLRGGYGCLRLLDRLDYAALRSAPKALIGYSDLTALHTAILRHAGVVCFHGPMPGSELTPFARDGLGILADRGAERELPTAPEGEGRRRVLASGRAQGPLLGGNLSLLSRVLGTPYEPEFDGRILFLEEVGEAPYRIDGYLAQLSLGGQLARCAGIALGRFTELGDDEEAEARLERVFDRFLGKLGIPVFEGLACGHVPDQLCFPQGVRAELNADAGSLRLVEPWVS